MTDNSPTPSPDPTSALDSETLRALVRRYLAESEVTDGWRPKRRLDSYVSEAFHLAALIDESASPHFPPSRARDLRERALAARTLNHEARVLRADRSRTRAAQATRRRAREWMNQVHGAIVCLQAVSKAENLEVPRRAMARRETTDDGLALQIQVVVAVARKNQCLLNGLGVEASVVESGYAIAQELRMISARQGTDALERMSATGARDHVLSSLHRHLTETRAALRYIHRDDPDLLRRIAR